MNKKTCLSLDLLRIILRLVYDLVAMIPQFYYHELKFEFHKYNVSIIY